ncbi:MAG TPA: chitinase [Actinocatenispora sp.]
MLRRRWWTALALTIGAAGAVVLGTGEPGLAAAPAAVAPYVDMSNSQVGLLDQATGAGLKAYTAAFVIGSGCNQIWGDTLPVGNDPNVDGEIDKARSEGAEPIISSGGAAGLPLAWTCTDQGAIVAGYQKLIDAYHVSALDFDIEGAAIADTASIQRNMQALKTVKDNNSGLTVSVTLPVLPNGLTGDGVNLVAAAHSAGLKLDVVNIMTMDYYQGNQDMGQAAIEAAKATLDQIQGVDGSYSYANIGVTPMIGTNDDNSTFSLDNARSLVSWAGSVHVARLAFWSVNRDQSCGSVAGDVHPDASSTCSGVSQNPLDFTKAFLAYGG